MISKSCDTPSQSINDHFILFYIMRIQVILMKIINHTMTTISIDIHIGTKEYELLNTHKYIFLDNIEWLTNEHM
jgi:hypothetical protein